MRYNNEATSTPLTIEAHQPSPLINLFPPTVLNPTTPYPPEGGGTFYPPTSHLFSSLDPRSRLGPSNSSTTGMAHRPTTLPHPQQITTRDQYTPPTPSFRRPSEHPTRSPSFPGAAPRRHPLSPTPSPITGYTSQVPVTMDTNYGGSKSQTTIPPLRDMTTLGTLQYGDSSGSSTPVKVDIHGVIDKGFFLADGDWTCYRRNYFSLCCSFSLNPYYGTTTPMHFSPTNSQQTYTVTGFAMSISAVVSDNEGHTIDLVQHTPKRDKGPIDKPAKVPMLPKTGQPPHHTMSLYPGHPHGADPTALPTLPRSMYDQGYSNAAGPSTGGGGVVEHTFERIQFKQATANNGKRRAAQQYYQLLVELWAEVGHQAPEKYVRVAYRKSEKMIVRGRSPGHYQGDRRGSTSSGPPAPGGSMGNYGSGMMGNDFSSGGPMMGGGYSSSNYDARGGGVNYGTRQHGSHHGLDMPAEIPMAAADETKPITAKSGYQYYPGSLYQSQSDPQEGVEMFTHQPRSSGDGDTVMGGQGTKGDYSPEAGSSTSSGGLPRRFHNGPLAMNRRCGPYESKSTSEGYYPTMVPQQGVNTMT